MTATARAIEDWWAGAMNRRPFRKALRELNALGGDSDDQAMTLRRVIGACYHATAFNPDTDPGSVFRTRMVNERDTRSACIQAARTLALACERDDTALRWALGFSINEPDMTFGPKNVLRDNVPVQDIGAAFFRALESHLGKKLPMVDGGPFVGRVQVGNLLYPVPISTGRPVAVESMLAFEIVFHLRRLTAGRAMEPLSQGHTMPEEGRPHYALVAAFCNATLATSYDGDQIRARLRKLPQDLSLISWPRGVRRIAPRTNSTKKTLP